MAKSRMLLLLALLGSGTAGAEPPSDAYQRLTSVSVRCTKASDPGTIVVCGRRAADKWRVPFIGYNAGDRRAESVSGERNRLASAPRVACGKGAIIANCGGGVGVSAGTRFDGAALRVRPLAD
jgi:hypothetical protein